MRANTFAIHQVLTASATNYGWGIGIIDIIDTSTLVIGSIWLVYRPGTRAMSLVGSWIRRCAPASFWPSPSGFHGLTHLSPGMRQGLSRRCAA